MKRCSKKFCFARRVKNHCSKTYVEYSLRSAREALKDHDCIRAEGHLSDIEECGNKVARVRIAKIRKRVNRCI